MLETMTYYLWNHCAVKIKVCSVLLRNLFRCTRQTAFLFSNTAFQWSKYIGKHHKLSSKIFFIPPNSSQFLWASLIIFLVDTSLQLFHVCCLSHWCGRTKYSHPRCVSSNKMIQNSLYDLCATYPHRYFILLHSCLSRLYLTATYHSICCVGVLLASTA